MIAALIVLAIGGWGSTVVWIYLAHRWQKIALSQSMLVGTYAKMLTASMQNTETAILQRNAALSQLALGAEPLDTHDRSQTIRPN